MGFFNFCSLGLAALLFVRVGVIHVYLYCRSVSVLFMRSAKIRFRMNRAVGFVLYFNSVLFVISCNSCVKSTSQSLEVTQSQLHFVPYAA